MGKPAKSKRGGATLQLEFDRQRWLNSLPSWNGPRSYDKYLEGPWDRIYNIAKTAACDTIHNGGTFILVVSDTTITMVQRPDAADLEPDEPPPSTSGNGG